MFSFFFFNDTATTEIYTLSLHDALPIYAYLSYYAGDFKTPGGEARPAWEKTRRERIAAPKSIEVKVDSPKVTLRGSNEASVTFRQDYRSDKLTSSNTKTLELVKADGRWRIREEKAGR